MPGKIGSFDPLWHSEIPPLPQLIFQSSPMDESDLSPDSLQSDEFMFSRETAITESPSSDSSHLNWPASPKETGLTESLSPNSLQLDWSVSSNETDLIYKTTSNSGKKRKSPDYDFDYDEDYENENENEEEKINEEEINEDEEEESEEESEEDEESEEEEKKEKNGKVKKKSGPFFLKNLTDYSGDKAMESKIKKSNKNANYRAHQALKKNKRLGKNLKLFCIKNNIPIPPRKKRKIKHTPLTPVAAPSPSAENERIAPSPIAPPVSAPRENERVAPSIPNSPPQVPVAPSPVAPSPVAPVVAAPPAPQAPVPAENERVPPSPPAPAENERFLPAAQEPQPMIAIAQMLLRRHPEIKPRPSIVQMFNESGKFITYRESFENGAVHYFGCPGFMLCYTNREEYLEKYLKPFTGYVGSKMGQEMCSPIQVLTEENFRGAYYKICKILTQEKTHAIGLYDPHNFFTD